MKWEYKIETLTFDCSVDLFDESIKAKYIQTKVDSLNFFGENGWELMKYDINTFGGTEQWYTMWKRQVP